MKISSLRVFVPVVFGLLLAAGSSGYAIPLPASFYMAGGFNVEVLANTTHYNELGFGDNFSFYFQSNPDFIVGSDSTYTAGEFTLRLTANPNTIFTGLKMGTSGWLHSTNYWANWADITQEVKVNATSLGTIAFQNHAGYSYLYGNIDGGTYWSTAVGANSFLLSFHEEPVSYGNASVQIGTVGFYLDPLVPAPPSVPDAFSTAVLVALGGMLLMSVGRKEPHSAPKSTSVTGS